VIFYQEGHKYVAFNRTLEELKYMENVKEFLLSETFNRTLEELKWIKVIMLIMMSILLIAP